MNQHRPEICLDSENWDAIPTIHRFSHDAMATTFEVIIQHDDASYARQAAHAAFDELDRLEADLSRFVENSDISRINNLAPNQPLPLSLDTFECLRLSARIYEETDGAFDITIGSLLACWLSDDKTLRMPSDDELALARQRTGSHLFKLNEAEHTVELLAGGVQIDLGAVGKGYAIDRMAALLRNWSVDTTLIHGGFSSVLALRAPAPANGWPVALSNPANRNQPLARLHLNHRALSGSGLQEGLHIIDPRTAQPVRNRLAAWAGAPDAATADALSTAFMVMLPEEIDQYCSHHPDASALVALDKRERETQKDNILRFGQWNHIHLLKQ